MSKDITDTAEQIIETLLPYITCEHTEEEVEGGRYHYVEYDLDSKGMAKLEQVLFELAQPKVTKDWVDEEYGCLLDQIGEEYFQLHGSVGMEEFMFVLSDNLWTFLTEQLGISIQEDAENSRVAK